MYLNIFTIHILGIHFSGRHYPLYISNAGLITLAKVSTKMFFTSHQMVKVLAIWATTLGRDYLCLAYTCYVANWIINQGFLKSLSLNILRTGCVILGYLQADTKTRIKILNIFGENAYKEETRRKWVEWRAFRQYINMILMKVKWLRKDCVRSNSAYSFYKVL